MKCQYCDGTGTSNTCVNGTFKPCAFCNGTGEVEVVGDSVTDVCDKCGGTGFCEMKMGDVCTLGSPCPHQRPLTKEEYIRTCSFEKLAGAIYEWYSAGYTTGRIGLPLNSITEIVEWLKEKHE